MKDASQNVHCIADNVTLRNAVTVVYKRTNYVPVTLNKVKKLKITLYLIKVFARDKSPLNMVKNDKLLMNNSLP